MVVVSNTCQVTTNLWVVTAVIATALGALVFVISYAWLTRNAWRRSAVGQNVMALTAVILVVSLLAVSAIMFGIDWPARNAIRAGAWWAVAVIVWWRVVLLFRAQPRDRS